MLSLRQFAERVTEWSSRSITWTKLWGPVILVKARLLIQRIWNAVKTRRRPLTALGIGCICVFVAMMVTVGDVVELNTYYYTFSTIAQTLAGAFAFLVAVVLYRMQSIEVDIERALKEVIPYAATANDQSLLQMRNRSHDWDDIERYISQEMIHQLGNHGVQSAVATNWNAFEQGRSALAALKREAVETLRLTSMVIGASMILIPVAQVLKTSPTAWFHGSLVALLLLILLLFLACRCLWLYWNIAKHLTDRKIRHNYVYATDSAYFSDAVHVEPTVAYQSEAYIAFAGAPPASADDTADRSGSERR